MELDAILSSAFQGGTLRRRELRLSSEDAVYITQNYPVRLRSLGEDWYEIIFQVA